MFKAVVTFPSGSTLNYESDTAPELSALLIADLGTPPVKPKIGRPRGSKTQQVESDVSPVTRKRRAKKTEWSAKDLLGVARIVRDNISHDTGISGMVISYIRKHGDMPNRKIGTIYTVVSDFRSYYKGEKSSISNNHKEVLESNGMGVVAPTGGFLSGLGRVRKVPVTQEA